MNTLYSIFHSHDNPLHNQFRLRNVPYTNRINPFIQPVRNKTNYGLCINIINRCQLQLIRHFNDILLSNIHKSTFLNIITNRLYNTILWSYLQCNSSLGMDWWSGVEKGDINMYSKPISNLIELFKYFWVVIELEI